MDNFFTCFTLITIGSATALLIAILVLYFRNRSILKEKDRVIYRRLQEQDSLTRELEKVQMEKDVIEQTLDKFISQLTVQSESNQIQQNNK